MFVLTQCFSLSFMQRALVALLIASPMFGILSTYVVSSNMAFFSDAIGHSAFTGIALGMLCGLDAHISIVVFALILGYAIISVKEKSHSSSDTVIGVFSSTAMALGLAIISRGASFNRIQNYLVGDILAISTKQIIALAVCAFALICVWAVFYNKLMLINLHKVFAKSRNIKTFFVQAIFALTCAAIVSCAISWTGLLLINSLLVLPAASSRMIAKNSCAYLLISVCISLICAVAGLVISYYANMACTATIVLLNAVAFALCFVFSSFFNRS